MGIWGEAAGAIIVPTPTLPANTPHLCPHKYNTNTIQMQLQIQIQSRRGVIFPGSHTAHKYRTRMSPQIPPAMHFTNLILNFRQIHYTSSVQ